MGQFKPMVKMETTEPSVELKLKKGGHVNMKKGGKAEAGHKKMAMGGGALDMMSGTPALIGRPAVNAPVRAPGKPSMSARRKAMMAKPATTPSGPSMAPPPMKKGGKAEGGESKKTHMAEMSKMKGLEKELKSHESKPASKGHKGLKTGGVALGNAGGFKKGGKIAKFAKGGVAGNGIINTEKQGGKYRDTLMHTAEYTGKSSGKTGDVKNGNGGGYKTGGVALGNAGGFKAGGKTSKKAYAAGGTVNSGRPVAMPEGRKPVPSPVRISQLAGTYKNGGKAAPGNRKLQAVFNSENATAMRQAKVQSNMKYGSPKRFAGGGSTSDKEMDMSNGAYDAHYANERAENEADRNLIPNALKKFGSFVADTFSPSNLSKSFSIQGNFSPEERKQNALTDARIEMAKKIKDARKSSGMEKKRGGRAC
jgi:hypothetical protein